MHKKCIFRIFNPPNDKEIQPQSVLFCTRELATHAKGKKNRNLNTFKKIKSDSSFLYTLF